MNNTPDQWEEHGTLEKGSGQSNYVYINFTQANISAGSTIHWMYIFYDKYQETTEVNTFSSGLICIVIQRSTNGLVKLLLYKRKVNR